MHPSNRSCLLAGLLAPGAVVEGAGEGGALGPLARSTVFLLLLLRLLIFVRVWRVWCGCNVIDKVGGRLIVCVRWTAPDSYPILLARLSYIWSVALSLSHTYNTRLINHKGPRFLPQ